MRRPAVAFIVAATLLAGADTDWPLHGRTSHEEHYSPLKQISDANVSRLGLAWSMELDTRRGLEATPLVVNGIMYFTSAWSVVYAVDARNGELKWTWDPKVARKKGADACCDVVNRGVALDDGRVFVATLDGRLAALDAATGRPVWSLQTTDESKPYTSTGAPRVANGRVFIGNAGAEYGVRGYISAYDTKTGKLLWRFYTVPGDPAKGFESPALERAAKTWTGEWWKAGGGGTVWDAIVYDSELDLLFVGTGNGTPWNRLVRSPGGGDNLYLSSILALRPATGELVWHYQTTPGDTWDFTATQPIILADLNIAGRARKVLMQAPKNGFFYVLDRRTGELISAELLLPATWTTGIDRKTGRPMEVAGSRYETKPFLMNPGPRGRHNYEAMALSALTGLVYIPVQQQAVEYRHESEFRYREGAWNTGALRSYFKPPSPAAALLAWDPVNQKEAWRIEHAGSPNGGVAATAGNLVFQGTADGRFVAYRSTDGTKLWESKIGIGIIASPITYLLDGRQYVSVLAGWGGASAMTSNYTGNFGTTGRLLTFALDGKASMPPVQTRTYPPVTSIATSDPPESVARGELLYNSNCRQCHGINAASGGPIADLRRSAESTYGQYPAILLKGALQSSGMPSFATLLTPREVDDIRAFVLSKRAELVNAGGNRFR